MPSPTSLSPFVSNYIEAFLLGTHNKTPELKDTLFGLFSVIAPEEIIEIASALYKKEAYGSLVKPQIIRNMQFLLDQFISLHTPYGLAPYFFKKDKLIRLFSRR